MSSSENSTIDMNVWRTAPYLITEFWKQFAAMTSVVLVWGWSILATSVLWIGATLIMHNMASDEYRQAYSGIGMAVIGAVVLMVPAFGLTALIRGIVRPLRPTRTLT